MRPHWDGPDRTDEVAGVVEFLLCDDAAYVTGSEITVDGGATSHGGVKSISDALRAVDEYSSIGPSIKGIRMTDAHTATAAVTLDRTDPEAAIAAAAAAVFELGPVGRRRCARHPQLPRRRQAGSAAALIRHGTSFSLSLQFNMDGPQKGWRRRTNPVHTMLDTGTDAEAGTQGFPHGLGGADDVITMPLQCSTQWDGLGHIFDHGRAWNGRRAGQVVTSQGDRSPGSKPPPT